MEVFSGRVKDGRESWLFLAVIGCSMILNVGPFDSFGILVVVFKEYFDETNTKIGWIGSVSFALMCSSFPILVSLLRRFGFRRMVFGAAVLFVVGYLTTPLVTSVNYLFLTYCIPLTLGVGTADCLTIIILAEYFQKSLGLATGIRYACKGTGSMMFSYLFPILIERMGWRKTFYCISSFGAVLIILGLCYRRPAIRGEQKILLPDEPDLKPASEANEPITTTSRGRAFLRDRGFQLIVLGLVPFFFVVPVPSVFMAEHAKSIGYPLSQAKWLVFVRGLASLVGAGIIGLTGDFASRHGTINHIASAVAAVFGLASGLCSLTQYLPLMILYMSVAGLLEAMLWVLLPLMVNDLTGGINVDYVFSLMVLLSAVGYLAGPSSMGRVYDVTGDFRNVLYVICVCSLVASVIIALGIYVRSNYNDESAPLSRKDNTCLRNIVEVKYSNISGTSEVDVIPEIDKKLVKKVTTQYETAV